MERYCGFARSLEKLLFLCECSGNDLTTVKSLLKDDVTEWQSIICQVDPSSPIGNILNEIVKLIE